MTFICFFYILTNCCIDFTTNEKNCMLCQDCYMTFYQTNHAGNSSKWACSPCCNIWNRCRYCSLFPMVRLTNPYQCTDWLSVQYILTYGIVGRTDRPICTAYTVPYWIGMYCSYRAMVWWTLLFPTSVLSRLMGLVWSLNTYLTHVFVYMQRLQSTIYASGVK